ncbi:VSIG10L isoform 1 [Pongo abelii]|uniref:VSIG10L isoform 1 n=1 Tax=Pongo abelii TaxID=9601 RepID=A0A2J8U996_PONAB|nr:VSIG10L isoform 1 [Pongo abelii]
MTCPPGPHSAQLKGVPGTAASASAARGPAGSLLPPCSSRVSPKASAPGQCPRCCWRPSPPTPGSAASPSPALLVTWWPHVPAQSRRRPPKRCCCIRWWQRHGWGRQRWHWRPLVVPHPHGHPGPGKGGPWLPEAGVACGSVEMGGNSTSATSAWIGTWEITLCCAVGRWVLAVTRSPSLDPPYPRGGFREPEMQPC